MTGPEEILEQSIADFVDMYGKEPTEETLLDWKIRMSLMYSEEWDE